MQKYYCYCSETFKKSLKKYRKKHTITNKEIDIFQKSLVINPLRGNVIPRYDVLRKIRLAVESLNVGKSDGYRVIYSVVYEKNSTNIFLWQLYYKKTLKDLSDNEYKQIIELYNNIDLDGEGFVELIPIKS